MKNQNSQKSQVGRRYLIKVTQEDIHNGKECDSLYCPIALAMKRELDIACVGAKYFCISGQFSRRYLPQQVVEFIRKFDLGQKVEPFNFYVTIPTV